MEKSLTNPKLSIITGVCGRNEITRQFLDTTIANCEEPHELVIVSNGSSPEDNLELEDWLTELHTSGWENVFVESPEPLGSTVALNVGLTEASGEIVAMIHNDLLVKQIGWDQKILDFYETNRNVGLVGFAGAKQLGRNDIYREPYELVQMARNDVYTSLEDWPVHGAKTEVPTEVAVLDGLTMCGRRNDILAIGGFDEEMIHHQYDNDICTRFHYAGYHNFVLPITAQHLNGQTANFPIYNDWLTENGLGRDGDVHKASHEYFYKKWKNKLPIRVE